MSVEAQIGRQRYSQQTDVVTTHELLWSRDRVVKLEDNRLAGKDCVSIRPTATQFCPHWCAALVCRVLSTTLFAYLGAHISFTIFHHPHLCYVYG